MQAASSIELDSTDRFGNNDLHTLALKKDFRSLVETAKNNPNLLIQKNQNGQTPLHLIQTMSQSVIANNKKNNIIKNNLLYSLIKINPESLSILDSKGNSLLDLLAVSVNGEDKEFIKKLAELNPSFVKNYKFGIELEIIQQEFTSIFGESLGEEDQFPEEQPLLENQNLPLQPSPTLPIPQEIKHQKQESSINEDQKNLNEELLQACKNDKNMKAVLLVRKGANPNALCQSGESAISYAKTTGNNKLVVELQKEESKKINSDSAPPEVLKDIPDIVPLSENQKGKEPIQEIRERKTTRHELLNEKLRKACRDGNVDEVIRQIEQGANPSAKDKEEKSAISYAKENKNKELLKILENNSEKQYPKEIIETNNHKPRKIKEKNLPFPAYTTFGSIACGALGASGCLAIACAYASSWAFPPAGIALTIIGGCMALGFIAGAIYSKKDVIANKVATVFHKSTAENKTFVMESDTHPKNA